MIVEFAIGFTQGVVVAALSVVIATAFYALIRLVSTVTLSDRKQGKKSETGNRRTENG